MQCPDHTRRSLILTALATGACLATESASSEDDKPGSDERRQKGDLLVVSEGEHVGEVIKPDDLKLGGPPVHAWPKDPKTSLVRSAGKRTSRVRTCALTFGRASDADHGRFPDDHWNLCRTL